MRQYIKTQCCETLGVLMEAHGEIWRLAEKHQTEQVFELLEQCQQGAISVGTAVDEAEGEGTDEVHFLEVYCEQLWQLHEDLDAKKPVSIKQAVKRLSGLLQDAEKGIREHLPTTREVVFLPYKASMWDSLESVWKKMDADPNVTAIVMPIPYYDKNPNGTFREVHYELDQFPDNVPVIGYRDYDIEVHHPDAIYIHNPYDENNYVTSVHPDFYSSKLRNFTEELVYIPYFVLNDDFDPDNKSVWAGVKHFCLTPGVLNAHRVILQSENMKKLYVNILSDHFGEQTRAHWETCLEGSGSPKLDRVANLTAEDYELPEEWRTLVEKPDGSKKKIIFYNTSVTALLQENDKMLEKIRRTFDIFRKNEDKVVLLWRPHPLIQATLTSMRPDLWKKYKALVNEYKENGWGIYDDSPDMDRAIAVSDAYFGDQSSIVVLYQKTGKPIMIQNVNV